MAIDDSVRHSPLRIVAALWLTVLVSALSSSAAAQVGVSENKIRIGIPGPFTGNASSYSKAQVGLEAFYNYINEQGGVHGRKIEVIKVDTACDNEKAKRAFEDLIHKYKVFLINGNSCSEPALAVKSLVEETGIPWVVGHAVNDRISTPPVRNIFHAVPTSFDAGQAMAKFVMSRPGTKRIAVVSHDNVWSNGYRNPALTYLREQHNLTPVLDLTFRRGERDATALVSQIKKANVDFIMAILYEAETVPFLLEAERQGLDVPILGGYGTDLNNTLKRVGSFGPVRNYYVLHMFVDAVDSPAMAQWRDMITRYFPDEKLSAFSFASIGSGMAVVEALQRAGPALNRENFISAMESLENFRTGVLAGTISYSPENRAGVADSAAMGFVEEKPIVFKAWEQPLSKYKY